MKLLIHSMHSMQLLLFKLGQQKIGNFKTDFGSQTVQGLLGCSGKIIQARLQKIQLNRVPGVHEEAY